MDQHCVVYVVYRIRIIASFLLVISIAAWEPLLIFLLPSFSTAVSDDEGGFVTDSELEINRNARYGSLVSINIFMINVLVHPDCVVGCLCSV